MPERRTLRERMRAADAPRTPRARDSDGGPATPNRYNIDPAYHDQYLGPRYPGADMGASIGHMVAGLKHFPRTARTHGAGTGEDGLRDRSDAEE